MKHVGLPRLISAEYDMSASPLVFLVLYKTSTHVVNVYTCSKSVHTRFIHSMSRTPRYCTCTCAASVSMSWRVIYLNVARKRPSIPCEPHQIWVPRPHVPARACRSSSL